MTASRVDPLRLGNELAAPGRLRMARGFLIVGAFGPYLITVDDAALQYANSGLSPLDVLRGGLPWLMIASAYMTARPSRQLSWGGPEILLAAFVCWAIASTSWSVEPVSTALKAVTLAASYLNIRMLAGRYRSASEAMSGLATFVHVILIWTGLQVLLWPSAVYSPAGSYSDVSRLAGKFPTVGSNLLALLAVLGIVLLLLRIGPRWTRAPFATPVLALVYLGELLATRTRSALIIGLVVVLIAFVAACRRTPWAVVLGSTSVAAAGLWGAANQSAISNFLFREQSANVLLTMTGRTITWDGALQFWERAVWLGHGYFAGHRYGLRPYISQPVSNLDNTWIETLVNLGVVGTVLIALFLTVGAIRALRKAEPGQMRVWVACVIVYGVMVSFINPSLQDVNMAQLVLGWCLLAYAECDAPVRIAQGGAVEPNRTHGENLMGTDRRGADKVRAVSAGR